MDSPLLTDEERHYNAGYASIFPNTAAPTPPAQAPSGGVYPAAYSSPPPNGQFLPTPLSPLPTALATSQGSLGLYTGQPEVPPLRYTMAGTTGVSYPPNAYAYVPVFMPWLPQQPPWPWQSSPGFSG